MLEFNIEQPFAQDAEEVVIGSCLLPEGDDTFDIVHQIVKAEDFFDPACRLIFECMTELANNNQPIDEITVFDRVRRKNIEGEIGGISGYMKYQKRYRHL